MSNVYELFPGQNENNSENPAQQQEPRSGIEIPDEGYAIEQTIRESRAQARASDDPRAIVTVSRYSKIKLDVAAVRMEQPPTLLIARSLGALIADEAFALTEEDQSADLVNRAQGYQLARSLFTNVSEFAETHQTTPDLLADIAVKRYFVIVPPGKPKNPYGPKRYLRSL